MSLLTRILELIETHGPMPFEDYQRMALYDSEEGFFASDRLRSTAEGDFLTSPEVSSLFGGTLAVFVDSEAVRLGGRIRLVEAGAGSGSLLGPLLKELEADVDAWAVEISPPARRSLSEIVGHEHVVGELASLDRADRGVVLVNELVDNIPVALVRKRGATWREVGVGVTGVVLDYVELPARREVAAWCDAFAGPVPDGGLVEVQLEACAWLQQAVDLHREGSIVVVDYGDTADGLAPRRQEGTLRTYRAHHLGPDPLADPGSTDITVDVNFTALEATLEQNGWSSTLLRQEDFLGALGLRDRQAGLRERELELARAGDEMERLQVRSLRIEADTLLHPRGLGDFRVLVGWSGEPPPLAVASQ